MANIKDNKFLKAALENIDAVNKKLSDKIENALQKAKENTIDADATLAELESQIKNQVLKLGSMKIPTEVYKKFADSVYEKINDTSELENYSSGNSIKKIWKKITNAISDIPNVNVSVDVTDENGTTRKVNYTIDFGWSFSLFGVSIVKAKISNDTDSVTVIFSDNLQETLVKYCAAVKQLENKLMNKVWTKIGELFLSEEDQETAKELLDVAYSDASPSSKLKKILGSTFLKKLPKDEIKSKINDLLGNDADKQIAAKYEELNTLYTKMENLISKGKDLTAERAEFISVAQSVLETDYVTLPDIVNDIKYNKNSTEITIPAGYGDIISASDYDSKVKKINATALTSGVNISGNDNANKIYGGSGADTLSGGSGNDTLTGGDGADIFYYEAGDGNDTITDYSVGEDLIKIGSGEVSGYSVKGGKDGILTIGKGKITLKGVGNNAISVVTADNETVTFGGIPDGLIYNKNDLTKATAVTIDSDYSGENYTAAYSSLVTLNASSRNNSVEITGNTKANKIYGGSGNDILSGEKGKDTINGGAGSDSLFGGADADKLFGDAGNDTLSGGKGNDTLTGGEGNDVFYYAKGDGKDVITDYAAGDKIYIDGANSVKASIKGNDVTFKVGSGSLKLQKVKNTEVTIEYSNGTFEKFLNGNLTLTGTVTDDATYYNGHCYKIYQNGMTWNDAKTFCENLGGHLVTITDANEQATIENLLAAGGEKNYYWLGGYRDDNDNWQWVTGETLSYTNWEPGEPNNARNHEDAMMIYYTDYEHIFGSWNDLVSDFSDLYSNETLYYQENSGFICEWDSIPAVSAKTAEIFEDNNFIDDTNIDSLLDIDSVGEISFGNSNNAFAQDSDNKIDNNAEIIYYSSK